MPANIIRSMALTSEKKVGGKNGGEDTEAEKELAEVFSGRTEILCIHQHESCRCNEPDNGRT